MIAVKMFEYELGKQWFSEIIENTDSAQDGFELMSDDFYHQKRSELEPLWNEYQKRQHVQAEVEAKIAARISGAMEFGKTLMVEYGTKNVLRGRTEDEVIVISSFFKDVQDLLLNGSLYSALKIISLMEPTDLVLREDLDFFINKIKGYLGLA